MGVASRESGLSAIAPEGRKAATPPALASGRAALVLLTCAAVTLGVVLRVDGFNRKSFWGDEVMTAKRLAAPSLGALLEDLQKTPFPPLYYLVLRGWVQVWGLTDKALRALPVVLGLLALPATFAVWGWLLGGRAALWALALLALSAYHIEYTQDAKMYAAVWLLATISCGAFLRVLLGAPRRRVWLVTYGLSTACLPLVSYVGVAPLAAQGLFGLWQVVRRRRLDRDLGDLGAVALLSLLPSFLWLPIAWQVATARTGITWIPPATLLRAITGGYRLVCAFLLGYVPPQSWPEWLPWTVPLLLAQWVCVVGTTVLLGTTLIRARAAGRTAAAHQVAAAKPPAPVVIAFLAVWLLATMLGAALFSLGVYSLWGVPRFLTGAAPALTLWVGAGLGSLTHRRSAIVLGAALLSVNLAIILIDRSLETRSPWRAMARTIADAATGLDLDEAGGARDLIVTWPKDRPFETDCLEHALRTEAPPWSGLRPFFLPLREALAIGRPFVLVRFDRARRVADAVAVASPPEISRAVPGFICRLASSTRVLDQTFTPLLCPFSTYRAEVYVCTPEPEPQPVAVPAPTPPPAVRKPKPDRPAVPAVGKESSPGADLKKGRGSAVRNAPESSLK